MPPGSRSFLYLHTIHPHNPYDPPEPFRSRFAEGSESGIDAGTNTLLGIQHGRIQVSAADQERVRGLYTGALAYNDDQLALFLEEIQRRYEPSRILVVVTSDHGEELFDHGGVLHGYTLYREQLQIPLVLWWPGHLQPRRVEAPTDNLELHDALRALVGDSEVPLGGSRLWRLALDQDRRERGPRVRFAAASSVKGGVFLAQPERFKLIFAPRTGVQWGMGEDGSCSARGRSIRS